MFDIYYVYALLDTRTKKKTFIYNQNIDYKPFYIGQGKNNRLNSHFMPCNLKKNTPKNSKINKIIKETGNYPISVKIVECLKREESLDIEKSLIKIFGRHQDNGILTNLDYGGKGCPGRIVSLEERRKTSERLTGKKLSTEHKNKILNAVNKRWANEEFRKKMSLKMKNRYFSEEHRLKISKSLKGRISPMKGRKQTKEHKDKISKANSKPVLQFDINNNFIKKFNSASEAVEKMNNTGICITLLGRTKTSGGYIWRYEK